MNVTVIENSWLAKVAAWKLDSDKVAMVIGRRIYLYNCTRGEFLRNKRWVRHEIAHVKQWARHGFLRFAFLYLLESFNKGYYHNKYEIEARGKEFDVTIMKGINII